MVRKERALYPGICNGSVYKRREAKKEKVGIYNGYGWGYVMPQPWSPDSVSVVYPIVATQLTRR